MVYRQQPLLIDETWSSPIIVHDRKTLNEVSDHSSVVLLEFLDADEHLTAQKC